ncbi:unnamed protein product [Somion occarium]|uniref:Uncharacterized protein n=1 Tax=Somion occarium TaxID=3059160 RepID=A0ABP1ECG3_9APHY
MYKVSRTLISPEATSCVRFWYNSIPSALCSGTCTDPSVKTIFLYGVSFSSGTSLGRVRTSVPPEAVISYAISWVDPNERRRSIVCVAPRVLTKSLLWGETVVIIEFTLIRIYRSKRLTVLSDRRRPSEYHDRLTGVLSSSARFPKGSKLCATALPCLSVEPSDTSSNAERDRSGLVKSDVIWYL